MAATDLTFRVPDPTGDGKLYAIFKEWLDVDPAATIGQTSTALNQKLWPEIAPLIRRRIHEIRTEAARTAANTATASADDELDAVGL